MWKILTLLTIGAALVFVAVRWGSETSVQAVRVHPGSIQEFVDEQGQTRLPRTYLVTMPFTGRIEPIELTEGMPVKAGQVVARVVPLDLELDVVEAQAAVDRAQASVNENSDTSVELTGLQQALRYVESIDRTVEAAAERVRSGAAKLEFADKTLERVRKLRRDNAASEEQLNQAEVNSVEASVGYQQDRLVLSALKSLQAATALVPTIVRQYINRKGLTVAVVREELAQAAARLKQRQRDQQRGAMTSPIDGIVLERRESNERMVAAGTVLLSIGNPAEMEVEADILSQDVVQVKAGNVVDVYGPAIGPEPVRAKVARIYPAGFTKLSSLGVEQQRVKVVIRFTAERLKQLRDERSLGVGYRVRVRIYTAEKSQALVVPRSALFRGPSGDWQVFAVRGDVAVLQTIAVGLINDEIAEVTAGLESDEWVVLAPEATLHAGARVRPINAAAPEAPDRSRQ
jgi:HlyD family secretion protein